MTFFPEFPKPTIWQRIKWLFLGKPRIEVPEFKTFTMPLIKDMDVPNLNCDIFVESAMKAGMMKKPEVIFKIEHKGK